MKKKPTKPNAFLQKQKQTNPLFEDENSWRKLDENVQSKTAFFKTTHYSKSGYYSSDANESYFEILRHYQAFWI